MRRYPQTLLLIRWLAASAPARALIPRSVENFVRKKMGALVALDEEAFDARLASLRADIPDTDEYAMLGTSCLDHPLARTMSRMDPFSKQYRDTAMQLYLALRGRQS